MVVRLKKYSIWAMLLIFPFFMPHSVVLLQQYSSFWELFYDVVAITRCLIACISIVVFVYIRIKPNLITVFVALYELSVFIACYINNTLTFQFSITNCVTYVGFACFIQIFDLSNKLKLLYSLKLYFAIMCFIGVLSVLLFPDGINNASMKSQAIYFLGSKNSGFFYYMMYMFLELYECEVRKRVITWSKISLCVVFVAACLITDSMNGAIMMFLLLLYCVIKKLNVSIRQIITPRNVFFLILLFAASIPFLASGKLDWFFDMIGRESNFSMRTFIWASAIELINNNPFFGNGKDGDLVLFGGQTHAHNIYLDYAAKYGLITVSLFILFLMVVAYHMNKAKKINYKLVQVSAVFYFIFFSHALFDSVSMPFIIVVLYYCDNITSFTESY